MTSGVTFDLSPAPRARRTSPRMLIHALLPLLLVSSTPSVAEDQPRPEVLATRVDGFGGPLVGVTQVGDGAAMLTGGRAGLVLDRRWLVGVTLLGTPLFLGAGAAPAGGEQLAFWQGGLLVQRQLFPESVVHPRVGAMVGGAWLRLETPESGATREGLVFAAEPQVGVQVNVARFLRVGLDVGYRFVAPAPAGLRFSQVSGVSGALTLHFGWF